jgi:glycosyltransferase involved in cell wall biosynthesis
MKILFLIPSLGGGGQEKAGMLLCNYLVQYHEVTAVCFEPARSGEYAYNCPIIRIPIATSQGMGGKLIAAIQRVRAMKKLKKQMRPDVAIAFGNTAIILNVLSSAGEKKIASVRQSFTVLMKQKSFAARTHRWFYVWALRKSDLVVPVSKQINTELEKYYRISNDLFINNGFEPAAITSAAAEQVSFMNGTKQWLIHSGRFDPSKGHWHLVRIFGRLKKQLPGCGLLLLGSRDTSSAAGKDIEDYCKKYLQEQNLRWVNEEDENVDVVFLGHQSNPYKYLQRATLFVFPSLWEGFPNALLEAMACGLPVVAANCATGPSDLLTEAGEQFGVLLPAFEDEFYSNEDNSALEQQWADALLELLNNNNQLVDLGSLASTRAQQYHSDRIGYQWKQLIEKLVIRK